MKKLAIVLLIITFVVSASAQSGRRVEALPTPAPESIPEPTFSESVPLPKRTLRVYPAAALTAPATGTKNAKDPLEEGEVEKIGTDLVTIPVSVFDRQGMYIPNLQQKNFKIFEDGEEQEIAYFGTSEKPFTVVLLLDTSRSTEFKIEEIQRAATAFVDQLKPQDRVMVVEFDRDSNVLTKLTNDRNLIARGISRADFGEGTSLYDAVDLSLQRYLRGISGKKAIVLFTDGVDTTSSMSDADSTLSTAEEAEVAIFPIRYDTYEKTNEDAFLDIIPMKGTTAREYAYGKKYLEELAGYTGGRMFSPESTEADLKRAFEGIAEELRRQYDIGYVPKKDGVAGQRKLIKVRVDRPKLVIRARDSYVVGRTRSSSKENK